MRERTAAAVVVFLMICAGCATTAAERRRVFVANHDTRFSQAILAGELSEGMSLDEIVATLGAPDVMGRLHISGYEASVHYVTRDSDGLQGMKVISVTYCNGYVSSWTEGWCR